MNDLKELPQIHAEPSKSFFVDMLTRDIGAIDCILDLVDNAVDRAVHRSGKNVMDLLEKDELGAQIEDARVEIELAADHFAIRDTCGGISVKEAAEHVFLFGGGDDGYTKHGLSAYGIGMKRAFFKLGRMIQMRSQTQDERFSISIDVGAWQKHPNWAFAFDEVAAPDATESAGTEILIPQLREGVGDRFLLETFQNDLTKRLASTYALFIKAGIRIFLNGDLIEPRLPTIVAEPFKPVRQRLTHDDVGILIIASLSPRIDRTAHGWYVFCNGRMVLEADKTSLTGWGEGFPLFHTKYNHFVGLVYFQDENVTKLPWRTTKLGVEKESPVFQAALNEMKLQARPILAFLNDLYPNDLETEGVDERRQLDSARTVALELLPKAQATFEAPRRSRQRSASVAIQFRRPRDTVKRIAEFLGARGMAASKVGEFTFDHFVANELQ